MFGPRAPTIAWLSLGVVLALEMGSPAPLARAQGPGDEAAEAYRRLIAAPPGSGDAYVSAFTPTLECFYGRVDVPRDRLRSRPLVGSAVIAELHTVEEEPGVATLVDRGWYGSDGRLSFHEKVVRMRQVSGRWLISGETGARSRGCLTEHLRSAPPPSWRFSYCRRAVQPAVRAMVRRCNEPDDVHGCSAFWEEANSGMHECFFGRTTDLANAPVGVTSIRDVPWSELRYFYRTVWDSEDRGTFEGVEYVDVDGDGREDAIVTLDFERNASRQAFSLRRGHVIELGEVATHDDRRCRNRSSAPYPDPRLACLPAPGTAP